MEETPPAKKRRRGGPRRRTGCNTCKRRHTRCDEKKPICGNCARLELECEQSDSTWQITHADPAQHHSSTEPTQAPDETRPLDDTQAPSSTLEVYRSHLSGLDQLMEHTPPDDMVMSTHLVTPPLTTSTSSPLDNVCLTSEDVFLLQTYARTVATWMDLFDHSCTYQLKVPQMVLASPLMFHSVCAFTASHLALSNPRLHSAWRLVGVRHYGKALRLLYDALSAPFCETTLTGGMLLLSYEIQGAIRSEDYRRHFLGLNILIKSHGITAQSSGTDLANFWIYCRHEIAVALANERPLVLDPEDWKVLWEDGESREDVLGNHVLWILARVINLIFGPDGRTEAGKEKRGAFLHELEDWRASLSDTFVGVPYGREDEDGFRKVYFTVTAAAAAAFWYHITLVLLYTEPVLQDESYIPLIQDQVVSIINITISDFPAALKVFSTHGLYYAAKHIQGISRKARVWNVLDDIQTHTGYHTQTTVKYLQAQVERGIY